MKEVKNNEILKIEKLKKYFYIGKNNQGPIYVRAVDGVTLTINKGETLGLVGESGSGKSTIAYTVAGMYHPTSGQILYKGKNIGVEAAKRTLSLKKEIQIVFQDPGSSLNPSQTIEQILSLPLRVHTNIPKKQFRKKIVELLEKVELSSEYLYKSPPSIGGGERQMVSIARAIAVNPSLVILDEPTSALDVSVQAKIINKLLDLQKNMRLAYLFITHDLSLMRNVANRIAIMYLGKICEVSDSASFFEKPLHPYTQMLISSVPVITEEEEKMKPKKVISTGEIPSPVNIPPGCSFHFRCPKKIDICSYKDPIMTEVSEGHTVRCHLYKK
ncbi:MAG TPA: peptide ABC transporter ATP-binding protein [Candidatus Atribacteria bacterium]|jgi:peptide/nickel transport system ATP-binding protein|nr:MAG: Oligopeptide/dipeptide ABC transporter, ATPase subunit [Atribacteria bacterium 34_128]HAJ33508.1 peptide ABC transporter ATP-binding protein [Candidatus Atribacteria bacterium]